MTGYNLNTPEWLWEAFKATVPKSQTLDEPLHNHMAERIAEDPTLDDDLRRRAAEHLDRELDTDDTAGEIRR